MKGKDRKIGLTSSGIMTILVVSMVFFSLLAGIVVFVTTYRASMIQNVKTSSDQAAVQVERIVDNYMDDISSSLKLIEGFFLEEDPVRDVNLNHMADIRSDVTAITSYDPETGEETETIHAVGTEYESKDKEYVSTDGLKTMTVDNYGRVSIDIQDAFGNTIISKDEAAGTWTESTYDYGDEDDDSSNSDDSEEDEDAGDVEIEETARLVEEKTYPFTPDEKKFIINENGETVANFYMTGKGKDILSGTKYFYDNLGNEIGTAAFSNGELDAAHCTSWSFSKSETEVTGEDEDAQTISTSYSKELNPSSYQSDVDTEDYYDQFNDAVLSETTTENVTDAEGNALSENHYHPGKEPIRIHHDL